uniref:Uncharacterized protein n=1 Tax=Arundo donax TaxID=35708 RepID=A0A0A8Y488_ARUDO
MAYASLLLMFPAAVVFLTQASVFRSIAVLT